MSNKNDRWSALSLKDRADLMNMYITNGISDLKEMKKHYNSFAPGGPIETDEYGYPADITPAIVEADYPRENEVWKRADASNADMVKRLKQGSSRVTILDWEDPRKVATHKMMSAGKYAVGNVQNINGQLFDFTDPKYGFKDPDRAAIDSAIERGDYIKFDTEGDARYFAEHYKKHYNSFSGEEDTNKSFWQKLLESGQSARDARLGAVGAQQVRDLYNEGKYEEAQELAKQYAKANTTGIALAGGAASTGLLEDLIITGATTTADTLLEGNVDSLGTDLLINGVGDILGHGIGKYIFNKLPFNISEEATNKIKALLNRFPEGVESVSDISKDLKERLIKEGVDPKLLTKSNLKKMTYLRSQDVLNSNAPSKFAGRESSKISNTYNLYNNGDDGVRQIGYVTAYPEKGIGNIRMIENITDHTSNRVGGVSELGYNTVIKDIGASRNGAVLMEPDKTMKVLDKYPDKKIISNDGEWLRNGKYTEGNPVYLLQTPTYDVPIKYLDDFSVEGLDESGMFLFDFTKGPLLKNGGKLTKKYGAGGSTQIPPTQPIIPQSAGVAFLQNTTKSPSQILMEYAENYDPYAGMSKELAEVWKLADSQYDNFVQDLDNIEYRKGLPKDTSNIINITAPNTEISKFIFGNKISQDALNEIKRVAELRQQDPYDVLAHMLIEMSGSQTIRLGDYFNTHNVIKNQINPQLLNYFKDERLKQIKQFGIYNEDKKEYTAEEIKRAAEKMNTKRQNALKNIIVPESGIDAVALYMLLNGRDFNPVQKGYFDGKVKNTYLDMIDSAIISLKENMPNLFN